MNCETSNDAQRNKETCARGLLESYARRGDMRGWIYVEKLTGIAGDADCNG